MNGIQTSPAKNSTTEKKAVARKKMETVIMADPMEKSSAISEKTRKEGNKLFKQKNHDKEMHKSILWAYSKSIAYAHKKSEQLASAYSNRSVLLMHLGRNKDAIVDIDRAMQNTKSEELLLKLVGRKGKLVTADKSLIKELVAGDKSFDKLQINEAPSLPSIAKPSKTVPCASDSVLLKYNETFGRHFVAARDIKPGEVIIAEEGYICMPKNNLRYFLCSHCMQFTWNGLPCEGCPFVVYCSEECKEEAWQDYHDIECRLFPYLEFMRSDKNGCVMADISIALRIFLKAVKKEGLDIVLNDAAVIDNERDDKVKGLLTEGVLRNDKFRSCYNLSSNVQYDTETNRNVAYSTMQMIKLFLTKTNIFDSKKNSENKIDDMLMSQLKVILIKIRHIVDINALSYQGTICECPDLDEPECNCGSNRGIIIAPCSSLVNHSCCSNVSRIFLPKKKVVFFTVTAVKKGDQLCDSYGPTVRIDKETRQKMLQQDFHFTCMCKACTENWPYKPDMKLLMNTKAATNTICQIVYEFQKVYPQENELFIFKDPEDFWGINKEGLEKAKLTCELMFKYCDEFMNAFLLSNPYRYYIDKVIFNLYGEKCTMPSVCA